MTPSPLEWRKYSPAHGYLFPNMPWRRPFRLWRTAWLAGHIEPETAGRLCGFRIGGMHTFARRRKAPDQGSERVSPFFIPMMIGNIAAGNIAIHFNAQGPCLPGGDRLRHLLHPCRGRGFHAIRHGYADAIIAGGAEATIEPLAVAGFINCMALSPPTPGGGFLPFDQRRPGLSRARARASSFWRNMSMPGSAARKSMPKSAAMETPATPITSLLPAWRQNPAPAPSPRGEGSRPDGKGYSISMLTAQVPLNDKAETLAIKKGSGREYGPPAQISSTKSVTGICWELQGPSRPLFRH